MTPADPDPKSAPAGANLLFLREEDIRLAQDLVLLAYRDLMATADSTLESLALGRAHHRALHFIARNPGISITALLDLLGITKQSLARVLNQLLKQELVTQARGRRDRRQRMLSLTPAGIELERRLFECQREHISRAYRVAGGTAVEGFRRVMRALLDEQASHYIDRRDPRS